MKRKKLSKLVLSETSFDIPCEDFKPNCEAEDTQNELYSQNLGDTETLIDRFAPCRSIDVAVNPNKLEELRHYFKTCFARKGRMPRCLLLSGPSGCGKTTAVQVISNELGYEVVEFALEHTYEMRHGFGNEERVYEASEEESFVSFLRKADYCSLERTMLETEDPINKVMIVEQLPNAFIRDPAQFRTTIEPMLLLNHSIIVFIFSDSDSTYELSHRRFFSREFIVKNDIAEISFNASATRFLQKALQRVARLSQVKVSTREIKRLAEESNGDIRCALRTFQFSVSNEGDWIPGVQPSTNTQINLFHMLGRILYAKRLDETPENQIIESRLPKEQLRRPPLERDLDTILYNSGLPDDQILMFLMEHTPNFSTSIKALSSLLTTLADCDARRPLFWENSERMLKHSNSYVAASKVMFENYNVPLSEGNTKKRSMYKFTKSKWTELCRSKAVLKAETETCARMQNIDNTGDLFTLRAPLASLINQSTDSFSLRTLGYLGRKMSSSWTIGRDAWMNSELQNRCLPTFDYRITSQATTESSQPVFNFDIEEDSS